MMKKRGFTLLELIVVVAIIGILTSVIVVSLSESKSKGINTAVKNNLNGLRTQATMFFNENNTYVGLCSDTLFSLGINAAANAGGGSPVCFSTETEWAASTALKASEGTFNFWCVDSSDTSKGEVSSLSSSSCL